MLNQGNLAVQELSSESLTNPVRSSARRTLTSTSRKLVRLLGVEVAGVRTGVLYKRSDACSYGKNGRLENDDEQKSRPVEASEDTMKTR